MILFALLSLFLIIPRNDRKYNSTINYMSLISGVFFGCALLVKFSAIFLPALLFQIIQSKNRIRHVITWLILLIAVVASWIFVMSNQHDLDSLLFTQLWQASRVSSLPYGIALQILFTVSPIDAIFGILGIMQLVKKKNITTLLLSVPYMVFLFRGGFVGFVHTIPILPILKYLCRKAII
jgi:4-amino-4-deoxy-L-arabinose transferase-like glycosyltransferase